MSTLTFEGQVGITYPTVVGFEWLKEGGYYADGGYRKCPDLGGGQPGETWTFVKNVVLDGELVVDDRGRIVATLTDDLVPKKWAIASAIVAALNHVGNDEFRLATVPDMKLGIDALREAEDGDPYVLDYTEAVGTEPFFVGGRLRWPFVCVDDGRLNAVLDYGGSYSLYPVRLLARVGSKT